MNETWYAHGLRTFKEYCFKYSGPAEAAEILTRYIYMQRNDPDPNEQEYCRGLKDAIEAAHITQPA